jgi:fibronectin type 3 domain-containing protein
MAGVVAFGQSAPPVYVLPAVDKAIIVLGDTPRSVHSFQVYRKGPGDRALQLLTPEPIGPARDAYQAVRLMGKDFNWIARKMDSIDPEVVWRKLRLDRNLALAYCLLSHGLRQALGRTWIDTGTTRGRSYQYRVVLLDAAGKEVQRYERTIRIEDPKKPQPPRHIEVVYEDGLVSIEWDYPSFQGGIDDRTVGFVVFRRRGSGAFESLFPAPVLRIEGHLNAFDDDLRIGETYTYGVVAIDIIGAASRQVDSLPLVIEDTTAPLTPMGLKATDREQDILLIWKMSPELDVVHYNVYRSFSVEEGTELTKINQNPVAYEQPRFVDSEAPRGIPLYYRVRAVDRRGNESPLSGPAPIIAQDKEPPGAVARLQARVDEQERSVELSWEAPEDPDLAGYYVYSGPDRFRLMRLNGKPLEPDSKTVYTDKGYQARGLEPGRSLVYGVSAIDNSYNEGPRTTVEVEIPDNVPPDPPSGLAARPSREGAVHLSWQPLLAFDLAGYRVYRNDKKDFTAFADLDKETTSWMDEKVEQGKQYRYYLTAIDSSGNESSPCPEVAIVPTDIHPPAPPTALRAESAKQGVRLSWDPCPDNDVKGYRVYRSEYPGGKPIRPIAEVYDKTEYLDRKGSTGLVYAVSTIDTSENEGSRREVTAE